MHAWIFKVTSVVDSAMASFACSIDMELWKVLCSTRGLAAWLLRRRCGRFAVVGKVAALAEFRSAGGAFQRWPTSRDEDLRLFAAVDA
jgi:hypothetical protein